MLKPLIDWYLAALNEGGYALIVLLMAVESSVAPLPSELVIPPAAVLAHNQGRFSLAGIVLAGTLGSWLGATAMYWIARWAGRPLVARFGKYLFLSPGKITAMERWVAHFGRWGVLLSRLLPVVRHLIGIPMGIAKMNFRIYSFYTVLGSALWCTVLCWIGVAAAGDQQLLEGNLHRLTLWFLLALGVILTLYFLLVRRFMK